MNSHLKTPYFQIPWSINCFVAAAAHPRLAAGLAGLGCKILPILDIHAGKCNCRSFLCKPTHSDQPIRLKNFHNFLEMLVTKFL